MLKVMELVVSDDEEGVVEGDGWRGRDVVVEERRRRRKER